MENMVIVKFLTEYYCPRISKNTKILLYDNKFSENLILKL
jgi:hypothetical protein